MPLKVGTSFSEAEPFAGNALTQVAHTRKLTLARHKRMRSRPCVDKSSFGTTTLSRWGESVPASRGNPEALDIFGLVTDCGSPGRTRPTFDRHFQSYLY